MAKTQTFHSEQVKTCVSCGKEKPLSMFAKAKRYKLGRNSRCTSCRSEWERQRRKPKKTREEKIAERGYESMEWL